MRLDDADPGPSAAEAFSGTSSARQIAGMLVAAPVRLNGTVAGAVVVTQELADSHAIINDLRRRSLLAGAVASVIAPLSRCYVRGRSPDR